MKHLHFLSLSLVSLLGLSALSGCSANFGVVATPVTSTSIGTLQGSVYGGQGPIENAEVFLFQTGTTGYASPSLSVLTSATGSYDTGVKGYYVSTDVNGEFSITGDYTCSPTNLNVQYYLYSIGGTTNVGQTPQKKNTSAAEVSALGACPSSGTFAGKYGYIYMNEVSTVAMMYAVQGFSTSATAIGIGPENGASTISTLAQQGLANAFLNAQQIYNIAGATPGHLANTVTPVGNGTVPQVVVDTIADILAACINSATGSTACNTLFQYATQNGVAGGGAPTDTAQAALYIAKHPASNVANLLALAGQGGDPFAPDLSFTPNDFTIAINYSAANVTTPNDILIDSSDNVWVTNTGSGTNTMVELNNQGAQINAVAESATNYAAFDKNGNLWTTSLTQPLPGLYYSYLYLINPPPSPYTTGAVGTIGGLPCSPSPCVASFSTYNSFDQAAPTNTGSNAAYNTSSIPSPTGVVADATGTYIVTPGGTTTGGLGLVGSVQWTSAYNGVQNYEYSFTGAQFAAATTNLHLWITSPNNGGTVCYINEQGYSGGLAAATCGTSGSGPVGNQTNTLTTTTVTTPGRPAISSNSGVWLASQGQNILYNLGLGFSGITPTTQTTAGAGGLNAPFDVAVDGGNTIWVANTLSNSVSAFNFNGSALSPTTGFKPTYFCGSPVVTTSPCTTSQYHYNLALDNSGDIWLANSGTGNITEIIGVGTPTITPIVQGIAGGYVGNVP